MNKTLVITTIALIAVVMGLSTVVPALANHSVTPLVAASDCGVVIRSNLICVAIDRDEDGVCDSDARSLIPADVARRLGIDTLSCS